MAANFLSTIDKLEEWLMLITLYIEVNYMDGSNNEFKGFLRISLEFETVSTLHSWINEINEKQITKLLELNDSWVLPEEVKDAYIIRCINYKSLVKE